MIRRKISLLIIALSILPPVGAVDEVERAAIKAEIRSKLIPELEQLKSIQKKSTNSHSKLFAGDSSLIERCLKNQKTVHKDLSFFLGEEHCPEGKKELESKIEKISITIEVIEEFLNSFKAVERLLEEPEAPNEEAVHRELPRLQAAARRALAQKEFLENQKAILKLQAAARRHPANREFFEKQGAARVIQAALRRKTIPAQPQAKKRVSFDSAKNEIHGVEAPDQDQQPASPEPVQQFKPAPPITPKPLKQRPYPRQIWQNPAPDRQQAGQTLKKELFCKPLSPEVATKKPRTHVNNALVLSIPLFGIALLRQMHIRHANEVRRSKHEIPFHFFDELERALKGIFHAPAEKLTMLRLASTSLATSFVYEILDQIND